ncbi:unnamed protein product [Adineta steineri]|nr:unnamed protein product [Adineta steineri]CAF1356986.1 unnamed protein product [Adineta steineri]
MAKKVDFVECLGEIDTLVKNNGFTIFNRFDLWSRRKDLVFSSHGHFSLWGIREINDSFARNLASSLGRRVPPAVPMTATPVSGACEDHNESTGKRSDKDRPRPHPYQRK